MPVLSYGPQLFNAEQGQASRHTLRCTERPLPGPRCQRQAVEPWGPSPSRPGCTRSGCPGCKRPCHDRTDPMLHHRKRALAYGMLATFLLCLACASRRIARELGVQSRTSSWWCWGLRHTAVSDETDRQWEGTGEADALSQTAGPEGPSPARRDKGVGPPAVWAPHATRAGPGPVARELASSTRPAIAPSRRCRRRWPSPSTRAAGCRRTPPAASGRRRALSMRTSITHRRNTRVARGMSIGWSACLRCSRPPCGCVGA
jgi:hypothetical protein